MIGTLVSHFRIVSLIGTGGMGVVYQAEDIKLRRSVALKFRRPARAATRKPSPGSSVRRGRLPL